MSSIGSAVPAIAIGALGLGTMGTVIGITAKQGDATRDLGSTIFSANDIAGVAFGTGVMTGATGILTGLSGHEILGGALLLGGGALVGGALLGAAIANSID